jgi:HTH-type transcriptional regulator / antitoxin HipB
MNIRTPAELGTLIRNTRQKLGLGQASLSKKIGVSRLWLNEIEKGKPRAQIGLVLRALDGLNITLSATNTAKSKKKTTPKGDESDVDIDKIIAAARTPRT